MELSEVHDYARRLMEAHGPKAIAEAAQKARSFEEQCKQKRGVTLNKRCCSCAVPALVSAYRYGRAIPQR